MKKLVLIAIAGLIMNSVAAQQAEKPRKMFRVYEDNDMIKLFGDVTDKGYTNGTRFDLYYTKNKRSKFFIERWMPKAGKDAVNTFGWGLTQLMYTPADYTLSEPDVKDWPYAGALYLSHTLHSANAQKHYNIQTEVVLGVLGPGSLAGPLQKVIHRNIGSAEPQGWKYQYPTDVLFNLNVTAEKQFWNPVKWLDVTGGAQALAGTMVDGANAYAQIHIGLMEGYFNGLISQYGTVSPKQKKFQAYVVARPAFEWIAYNAVLEGGVFSGKSDYYKAYEDTGEEERANHAITRRLDLGIVFAWRNIGLSFTQRIMPTAVKGFSHQRVGNLSLYVNW